MIREQLNDPSNIWLGSLRTPVQQRPVMMRQRKGGGHMDIPPAGLETGQLVKNWGGKRNGWIAAHLPPTKLLKNPK
jgi:hypothetical protein